MRVGPAGAFRLGFGAKPRGGAGLAPLCLGAGFPSAGAWGGGAPASPNWSAGRATFSGAPLSWSPPLGGQGVSPRISAGLYAGKARRAVPSESKAVTLAIGPAGAFRRRGRGGKAPAWGLGQSPKGWPPALLCVLSCVLFWMNGHIGPSNSLRSSFLRTASASSKSPSLPDPNGLRFMIRTGSASTKSPSLPDPNGPRFLIRTAPALNK